MDEGAEQLGDYCLITTHATHAAFTTVYPAIKWSYLTCTTEGIGTLFQPLETIIRSKLTPAPTGQPPGADLDLKDRGGIVHERSTRVKNLGAWLCTRAQRTYVHEN